MKKFLCFFLFSLLSLPGKAQVQFTNYNEFETTLPGVYSSSNAVSGWTIDSGFNPLPGIGCSGTVTWNPGSSEFSIVATPVLGTAYTGSPAIFSIDNVNVGASPLGGLHIARLNDVNASSLATRMRTTITVSTLTPLFQLAYCGSWQSINHTCCDRPAFIFKLLDAQGLAINCYTADLSPVSVSCAAGPAGNTVGEVKWLDWRIENFDLTPFIGSVITIELINSDCNAGSHYGSVYVDMAFSGSNMLSCPNFLINPPEFPVNFCSTSTVATISAPLGYTTYSWVAPPSAPIAPASATLSVLTITNPVAGDVYTLQITNISNCVFSNTYTLSTTQVSIAAVSTVSSCAMGASGSASLLCAGSASGYNYTWLNSANTVVGTSSVATNLAPGVYNVSVTALGAVGCGSAAASVTIGALQTIVPSTIIKPFCGSTSVLYAPSGSTNIRWYLNTASITTVMGGTVSPYIANSVVNGQVYQLGYSTPQGCRDSLIFIMSQTASGSVSVNNIGYACPAVFNGTANIVINPSPISSGSANTFSLFSSSPFQPTMTVILGAGTVFAIGSLAPATYSIIGSDAMCTFTTTFSVSVFTFSPQLSSSAVICPNSNTLVGLTFSTPIAPGQYSFAWSPTTNISGGSTSTANIAIQITNPSPQNPPVTTVYSVVITPAIANCPVTRTIAVLFANGAAPLINPIPELCTNSGTYAISALPAGGTYSTGSGIWLSSSGIIQSNLITASGVYTLSYTSPGGCSVSATSFSVSKFNSAALTNSVFTNCNTGSCINLMGMVQSTVNGIWSGTSVSSNTFCPIGLPAGSYSLVYGTTSTPNTSLCPDSKTLSVNITNPLTVTITSIGNLCSSSAPVQLSASPAPGSFIPTPYLSASGLFTPSLASIGNNSVQYAGNCLATASILVSVEAFVAPTLTLASMSMCQNAPTFNMMSLAVNPVGNWAGPGMTGSMFNPAVSGPGNIVLYYMTSSSPSNLCPAQQSLSVMVNPTPTLSIQGASVVCLGQLVTLQASGANTYSWNTGFNGSSFTFSPAITNTYMVTGTSQFNCSASQVFLVTVITCTTTNLNEQTTEPSLDVYPNPTSGIFYIEPKSELRISISDALGKTILEDVLKPGKQRIDLSKFSNGLYFLNFTDNNRSGTIKLLKE